MFIFDIKMINFVKMNRFLLMGYFSQVILLMKIRKNKTIHESNKILFPLRTVSVHKIQITNVKTYFLRPCQLYTKSL